jgi:hypothetical protein
VAYALDCQGKAQCHKAGGATLRAFGRIMRINIIQQHRRIFVPIAYASRAWRRGYNRGSALEGKLD